MKPERWFSHDAAHFVAPPSLHWDATTSRLVGDKGLRYKRDILSFFTLRSHLFCDRDIIFNYIDDNRTKVVRHSRECLKTVARYSCERLTTNTRHSRECLTTFVRILISFIYRN